MDKQVQAKPRGIFVIVDDDLEEHELLGMAMDELDLKNQIKSFADGLKAYEYLIKTKDEIFIILCDVDMPKMDGLELKRLIEMTPELKIKAIPFFFHSNSANPAE